MTLKKSSVTLIVVMALAIPSHSWANRDLCKDIAKTAYSIMVSRQGGVSLKDALGALGHVNPIQLRMFLEDITIAAYEVPRTRVLADARNARREFTKEWYAECRKAFQELK